MNRDQRRARVAQLHAEGWSVRRIAADVGAAPSTVHLDLDHVDQADPDPPADTRAVRMLVSITGTRGRQPWPPAGHLLECGPAEAEHLVHAGLAEPGDRPGPRRPCPGPQTGILRRPCPAEATIPAAAALCVTCDAELTAAVLADDAMPWRPMAGLNRPAE